MAKTVEIKQAEIFNGSNRFGNMAKKKMYALRIDGRLVRNPGVYTYFETREDAQRIADLETGAA